MDQQISSSATSTNGPLFYFESSFSVSHIIQIQQKNNHLKGGDGGGGKSLDHDPSESPSIMLLSLAPAKSSAAPLTHAIYDEYEHRPSSPIQQSDPLHAVDVGRTVLTSFVTENNDEGMDATRKALLGLPCLDISIYMDDIGDWTRLSTTRSFFATIYLIMFIVGITGNAGIIVNIANRKRLNVVPNIFLINLSVSNLLLTFIAVPIAPFAFVLKQWYLGSFLCKLIPLAQSATVLVSSFGLICIAFDRYRNISLIGATPLTPRHAMLITLLTWTVSTICNSPLYINTSLQSIPISNETTFCGDFCGEFGWPEDGQSKKIFGTAMFHIQFILPVILMMACYYGVWSKIRRDMLISSVAGEFQRVRAAKRKTRVLIVLILMIAAFVISWLPLTIVNILRDYDVKLKLLDKQPYFSQLIFHSVAMSSVMWNPILYFWMNYNQGTSFRTHNEFEIGPLKSTRTSRNSSSLLLLPRKKTGSNGSTKSLAASNAAGSVMSAANGRNNHQSLKQSMSHDIQQQQQQHRRHRSGIVNSDQKHYLSNQSSGRRLISTGGGDWGCSTDIIPDTPNPSAPPNRFSLDSNAGGFSSSAPRLPSIMKNNNELRQEMTVENGIVAAIEPSSPRLQDADGPQNTNDGHHKTTLMIALMANNNNEEADVSDVNHCRKKASSSDGCVLRLNGLRTSSIISDLSLVTHRV